MNALPKTEHPSNPRPPQQATERQVVLTARLAGNPKQWLASLSDAGFASVRLAPTSLELTAVQSADVHGQPFDYIFLRLSSRQIVLSYTLRPGQRAARRQMEAARLLLLTLSALPANAPPPALCAGLRQSMQQALDSVSESGEQLLHQNEQLLEENAALRARVESLGAAQEAAARQLLKQAQSMEDMRSRLEALSALPDAALDEEVLEWLVSHDGHILLREVAALHGVPPARVEESLDRLSKTGRIARAQG
ncbi:MAG: hypothetical protein KGH63_03075 [Candidatus Micrarchaeota archaeon]|nr:hypothetical protein [Candidatus Micrarchaeota archaeon]